MQEAYSMLVEPQKTSLLYRREHPDWVHHCIVWQLYANSCKAIWRVVRTAELITRNKLKKDIYWSWCLRKAHKITSDLSHSHPQIKSFSKCSHQISE